MAGNDALFINSILHSGNAEMKTLALNSAIRMCDYQWPILANALTEIEILYEDETYEHRMLAAVLASMLYFHLECLDDALLFFLRAEGQLELNRSTPYKLTLITCTIDSYRSSAKLAWNDSQYQVSPVDPKKNIFSKLIAFGTTVPDEELLAVSLALDCYQLDAFKSVLTGSKDLLTLINYIVAYLDVLVDSKDFQKSVLDEIIDMYKYRFADKLEDSLPNYMFCLYERNKHEDAAEIFKTVLKQNDTLATLIVYQSAFDISEIDSTGFCSKVALKIESEESNDSLYYLREILSRNAIRKLSVHFRHSANATDLAMLDYYKTFADRRSSILHLSLILAHGILQAGTTCDVWFRANLDWIGRANSWAKFAITASLGSVHLGNLENSRQILRSYLPGEVQSPSLSYSEGGALFALGTIHCGEPSTELVDFISEQLKRAVVKPPVLYGGAVALGLINLGQPNNTIYEHLIDLLNSNECIVAEGAAFALGCMMFGTGDATCLSDLNNVYSQCPNERVVRASAMAAAFTVYGNEDEANGLISQLLNEHNQWLRFGGCYALGLAYCGTGKLEAIEKLLQISSSDVSPNVRRAAVICMSFILCDKIDQLVDLLSLVHDSHDLHRRYGAALALGLCAPGSGNPEAFKMLESLSKDTSDIVRQGAYLASALLFQNNTINPQSGLFTILNTVQSIISDKHQSYMARFGAGLAFGMLLPGGQNTISMWRSPKKSLYIKSVAGFALFSYYWYWFPFINCISLSLRDTCFIGITKDLWIPQNIELSIDKAEHLNNYITINNEKKESKKQTLSAQLSGSKRITTFKNKAAKVNPVDSADQGKDENKEIYKLNKKPLINPCRVISKQEPYIQFPPNCRYYPVVPNRKTGTVVLFDTQSGEEDHYTKSVVLSPVEKRLSPSTFDEVPPSFEWKGEI